MTRPRLYAVGVTGVIALSVLFVASNLAHVTAALRGLGGAAPLPVAIGGVLSVAAMANRGWLNSAAHRTVGLPAAPISMVRISAVGFAANKIVRSGGASGLAVFLRHGRRRGFAGATVTASCVVAALAAHAALGVVLTTAIGLVAASGDLSGWWIAAAAVFGASATGIVGVTVAASRSRDVANRLWARGDVIRCRLLRRERTHPMSGLDDLYTALASARSRGQWVGRTLAHAVVSKVLGAAMLLTAAAASGAEISLSAGITIYAAGLAASFVSFVPAGVGFVEASTTALFVHSGASLPVAAVAVALFRIFDMWLPLATGACLSRHELRASKRDTEAGAASPASPSTTPATVAG